MRGDPRHLHIAEHSLVVGQRRHARGVRRIPDTLCHARFWPGTSGTDSLPLETVGFVILVVLDIGVSFCLHGRTVTRARSHRHEFTRNHYTGPRRRKGPVDTAIASVTRGSATRPT